MDDESVSPRSPQFSSPPVDARVQKAYNWAFGVLRSTNGTLRVMAMHNKQPVSSSSGVQTSIYMDKWAARIEEAADQFYRLYRLEAIKALLIASDLMKEAMKPWREASQLPLASPEFFAVMAKAREKLQAAEKELRQNCPIRYRLWLLNPWRYYPAKLP